MTLPMACIISTGLFLGSRNTTASSAGISTPSCRHLAFDNILHSLGSSLDSLIHSISFLLSFADMFESTCFTTILYLLLDGTIFSIASFSAFSPSNLF